MLLKNHSLFLNPSEEESKRIEKIDSFDGITEDVFNKTLVDMFNGILSKNELERFIGDLQIVTIPGLNKVNDYVDHHNDYINVIKNKLQYILEIYDMDNIEMKANAITEAFGSIANFIQISNFLDSDVFRDNLEKEADYILYCANNPRTAKEIEKFNEIERIVKAKNTAIKNYNSVRIIKELLVLAVLHKLERKIKRLKKKAKAVIELKNTPETITSAKEILTTLNKESNKDSNKVFSIRKSNKEMTREEKIEVLDSFLTSLKPFDIRDAQQSEFASMFNNLIKFVKDSNTKKDSIVDIIEVNIDSMFKKFESVIDSFEFRQDLLNASQKINQKEALRKQRIYEIKSSEKTYDYVAEMTKFDTDMIKIEAHIQFKKYSQYILAKLKEARNLVKNIKASKPEKIVWDNISSPGITKNNREVSNETREKAFKNACDIFGITTDILPELFGGIKVINPAHNFFENPAVQLVLDNNGCFNTILMELLEAQDKIKTSKQTESEEITENRYKTELDLAYGTFLIDMKNKKGIKLPKNFQSTFAILVNNFIEKYTSYKTPAIYNFHSYDKIKESFRDINTHNTMVIISTTTTGTLIDDIIKINTKVNDILVLFYYPIDGKICSNKFNSLITLSSTMNIPSAPKNYNSENCKFCKNGSIPVQLHSEQFILSIKEPSPVKLTVFHQPNNKQLNEFFKNYSAEDILNIGGKIDNKSFGFIIDNEKLVKNLYFVLEV